MKITTVDAIVLDHQPTGTSRPAPHGAQDPLIIRIRTDEGITGYGEADTFALVARAIVRASGETVIASGLAALRPPRVGSGIAKAAALQPLAAMRADELFEYRIDEPLAMASLAAEKFPVTDGTVAVPSGPDFGITVDNQLA